MRCPKCGGSKSSVVDSRQAEDGNTIRRRRECEECHYRFGCEPFARSGLQFLRFHH